MNCHNVSHVIKAMPTSLLLQQSNFLRASIVCRSSVLLKREAIRPPYTYSSTSRQSTTGIVSKLPTEDIGFFKKLLRKAGWLDHSKSRLKVSGYILYESVADQIPYSRFFKEFRLPDTFFSWFLITELHVWMLMVRTMDQGEEGRFTRNCVVEAMWQDVSMRAKKLGAANPSSVREQVQELSQQFQAAIIGYDEGLLSDDRVLAGAVWRRFFQRSCDEPEKVELLVHYIRKQVCELDKLPSDNILLKPNIAWINFDDGNLKS